MTRHVGMILSTVQASVTLVVEKKMCVKWRLSRKSFDTTCFPGFQYTERKGSIVSERERDRVRESRAMNVCPSSVYEQI